ncbi:helix-turn-helix domain-containing protein [Streptomyces sp. 6N223]|uniref:helix-turn-helix domain-containing protein n=1 Tax=Streptomyces sp. 6N223 TaxID=3457412 RepID=UPI003FCFBA26
MAAMTATPPLISPDLLTREDLTRALAEHDFASAFALLKKYGGLSQNRIAAACRLTPGKVSRIVNNSHQVTSYEVIARIADGLRIPGHLVGLAARPWETREASPTPPPSAPAQPTEQPWMPEATVSLAARLTRNDLVMDRRAASRALAATVASGASLLDSLEGWLQNARRSPEAQRVGRLGGREVEQLEQTAEAFRRWDHQFGGGLRRKAVLGQLNEVAAALEEHQTPDIERRLFRVLAQLAGTAATMAWDSGLQRTAQDYYRLALRAAHAGEDRAFGANVLAGMARQLLYRDRPQDALELVRLAQDGSRGAVGARVRAMLHTREAWAFAAMGRPAAFHRATAHAAEALVDATTDSEPYWIRYFDASELAGVTGGRLLDMARKDPRAHADAAAEQIRQAITTRGPEARRSHALDRIGLAECSYLLGDLTAAVAETHRAVDASSRTQSSRVRAQLGNLYPYTVGRSASAPVREARDRIRDLLSTG